MKGYNYIKTMPIIALIVSACGGAQDVQGVTTERSQPEAPVVSLPGSDKPSKSPVDTEPREKTSGISVVLIDAPPNITDRFDKYTEIQTVPWVASSVEKNVEWEEARCLVEWLSLGENANQSTEVDEGVAVLRKNGIHALYRLRAITLGDERVAVSLEGWRLFPRVELVDPIYHENVNHQAAVSSILRRIESNLTAVTRDNARSSKVP